MMRRLLLVVLVIACVSACTEDADPEPTGTPAATPATSFSAQVASSDLAAGSAEPVQIGIFSSTDAEGVRLVSFGEIDVAFSFLGDGNASPVPGPTTTAGFVPAAGNDAGGGDRPTLTDPAEMAGVYVTRELTLPDPGVWNAAVTVSVDGAAPIELDAAFNVYPEHRIPAPGERAPRTKNNTIHSKGVPPVAIDSRAQDGAKIPDPELHQTTIADAIQRGRPAVVQFATPVYCLSRFCGPTVEAQEELAAEYGDVAEFIHIEIWRDYQDSVVNRAAADWLLRNDSLTEPWLYLIDADGVIVDRWGPLFDLDDVRAELEALR